jgi:gluconate 2-dehydrogenase gamma chain
MPNTPEGQGEPGHASDPAIDRRGFMKIVGVAGATAGALPLGAASVEAQAPATTAAPAGPRATAHPTWLFLNSDEAAFIIAAADTLIPSDSVGPGAVEVGVPTYVDRQLAGAYGKGDRLYLDGPFPDDPTPQQGYQLPMTPAELVRTGIADVNAYTLHTRSKLFADLTGSDRAAVMSEVEKGSAKLAGVPAPVFFNLLLQLVNEGYFADPIYGGNKDKAVWKMLGFPGAGVIFTDKIVAYRNKPYTVEPMGIADLT